MRSLLPNTDTPCSAFDCLFNFGGVCPNPKGNKPFEKSFCHYMNEEDLLKILTRGEDHAD